MFRRPALSLAEVAWRWSFGGAACVLFGLAFLAYLDTLPVDRTDMLLLRTGQPVFVGQAFTHILHGSALRVALASIILFSALALLWIVLASLGRGVTLVPLLEDIRRRAQSFARDANLTTVSPLVTESTTVRETEALHGPWRVQSLAGLNFLRAALALAAIVGTLGAIILAGFVSTKANPNPGLVFFLAFTAALLLWLIWSTVSWFLSVAAIFVVRQGHDTFAALSASVDLCRHRLAPVLAVGSWFGLTHLVVFLVASSVVVFPFALLPVVPMGFVLTFVLLLTLLYFAIVDTLYIGRLAGYVAILEAPPTPPPSTILTDPAATPSAVGTPPESAMVDQDEPILSDIPIQHEAPALSFQDEAAEASEESKSGKASDNPTQATKSEAQSRTEN